VVVGPLEDRETGVPDCQAEAVEEFPISEELLADIQVLTLVIQLISPVYVDILNRLPNFFLILAIHRGP